MKISRLILFISISYFLTFSLYAQQNNFRIFNLKDGLPQSMVYSIIQDSRGYLWVGTGEGGVCRFDGKEFSTLNMRSGLAGNTVRAILEDSKGNLWFGTENGLNFYDGYDLITLDTVQGFNNDQVMSLYEDSRNIIWAGTAGGGLYSIKYVEKDSFLVNKYTIEDGLDTDLIFDINEDKFGRLWLAMYGGLNILTFVDDSFEVEYLGMMLDLPFDVIYTIEKDNLDNFWLGTLESGAYKIEEITETSYGKLIAYNMDKGLGDNIVWSILADSKGDIWLGTGKGGINKISNSGTEVSYFQYGMPMVNILCVFEDISGNIWFGTNGYGLFQFLGDNFAHYTEKEGLPANLITDIVQDNSGGFWLASRGGGLIRLVFENGEPVFYHLETFDDILCENINSLFIMKDGDLLIANETKGLAIFNGIEFVGYTSDNFLIDDCIYSVFEDSKGNIWCGTRGGLSVFDGNGFFNFSEDEGLINNEVLTFIEDQDGSVWAGTEGGLIRMYHKRIEGRFWISEMRDYDEEEGLYHKEVNALAEDILGNIWIGTNNGGIYRFEVSSEEYYPISQVADDSLLNSNSIKSLLFIDDYTLLAGTNVNFVKIDFDESFNIIDVRKYDETDGFTGVENNPNAIFKDKENNIWFGTSRGITRYDPLAEKVSSIPPVVHITGLELFREEIDWNTKAKNISRWFNTPVLLKLKHYDNHLTFRFSGISFNNPQKVLYKYQLEGLDRAWSPLSSENRVVYPVLNPGDYSFKVLAVNENGIWSPEPVTFNFTIRPPFWKTWWFYTILGIIVTLIIFSYIKYRERQLVREKRELEEKVVERTVEISKQKTEIEEKNKNLENANEEITRQKEVIEKKNIDITDSITYAKRIQDALLPSEKILKEHQVESFILYQPKDIVSGDFYWVNERNNKLIIVAADCTGHGVPGAFMSMLGMSFLNEIVGEKCITDPDEIINVLRENVITSLKQTKEIGTTRDGMDMALFTINFDTNILHFAGANNPLYLVREDELIETKGDRMPVAIHDKMDKFTRHEFKLEKNDSLYIFSDGYPDQFGGPNRKKFKTRPFKQLLLDNRKKSMKEQKDILFNTYKEWKGDVEQIDDIVIVGMRI